MQAFYRRNPALFSNFQVADGCSFLIDPWPVDSETTAVAASEGAAKNKRNLLNLLAQELRLEPRTRGLKLSTSAPAVTSWLPLPRSILVHARSSGSAPVQSYSLTLFVKPG